MSMEIPSKKQKNPGIVVRDTQDIKLRAWDFEKKEWVDSSTIGFAIDGQIHVKDMPPSRYDVLQYTGVDFLGRQCYEGDILENDQEIYVVEWDEDQLRWMGRGKNCEDMAFSELILNTTDLLGNVYENPELLDEVTRHPK